MMQTIFKKKTDDDEISRLFKNFDTNKNGEITLQGKYLVIGHVGKWLIQQKISRRPTRVSKNYDKKMTKI